MKETQNFTEGRIFAPLIRFALPVLLALFLQTMYGAVDLGVVGQFGGGLADVYVSAVSTGSQIMQSVTIVTADSGWADALSTAVFLMPYEMGRAFVDSLEGVEAFWILSDNSVQFTDGMLPYLRSQGATSND